MVDRTKDFCDLAYKLGTECNSNIEICSKSLCPRFSSCDVVLVASSTQRHTTLSCATAVHNRSTTTVPQFHRAASFSSFHNSSSTNIIRLALRFSISDSFRTAQKIIMAAPQFTLHSRDPNLWRSWLDRYPEAIRQVASTKTDPQKLLDRDGWLFGMRCQSFSYVLSPPIREVLVG